jgi:outer membrane murein-binding lipoprotein Lpp
MKVQIKNRNLVFIALFAITATFLLGGYVSRKKSDKVLEATKTTLNSEITGLQYKVGEMNDYIMGLERLVRDQTLLIRKSEDARKDLKSVNTWQRGEIKKLKEKIDSLSIASDEVQTLEMLPELEGIPDYPL